MRIFGWTIGRTSMSAVRYLGRFREARCDSATDVVKSGDIYGFIYGVFDRRLGRTVWRFSLNKRVEDKETGEVRFQKSFAHDDEENLYKTVLQAVEYIRRALGR